MTWSRITSMIVRCIFAIKVVHIVRRILFPVHHKTPAFQIRHLDVHVRYVCIHVFVHVCVFLILLYKYSKWLSTTILNVLYEMN